MGFSDLGTAFAFCMGAAFALKERFLRSIRERLLRSILRTALAPAINVGQLGDHAAAVKYLVAAKADFIEYGKKINEPEYWKANIEVIERKIKKLRGN